MTRRRSPRAGRPTEAVIYDAVWRSGLGKARCRAFWDEHGRYCDRCHGHRRLQCHHGHYADQPGRERSSTLYALCRRHHRLVHRRHRREHPHDPWPYAKLTHVTRSVIRRGWWQRALRPGPARTGGH